MTCNLCCFATGQAWLITGCELAHLGWQPDINLIFDASQEEWSQQEVSSLQFAIVHTARLQMSAVETG